MFAITCPIPTNENRSCDFENLCCVGQVRLPTLRNTLAVHSQSDVRNERNNAAQHTTEIAVASASAAEIE